MTHRIILGGVAALFAFTADGRAQLQCTQVSTAGPPVRDFGSTYDSARGRTILFAGERLGLLRSETWEWDGSAWTMFSTAVVGQRGRPAIEFDAARGNSLMFGGVSPSSLFLNDTWTWDGATWTQQVVTPAPTQRSGAAMAYDPVRQLVVLFGGFVPFGSDSQETWEWNGTAWSLRSVGLKPQARGAHRLVYDPARGACVLFGGWRTPQATTLGDTWQWDGAAWSQSTTTQTPPNRCDQAMLYDEVRGRVVMYGGLGSFQQPGNIPVPLGDFWVLESNGWQSKSVAGLPAARAHPLGEFDVANAEIVVHSGFDSSSTFNQTYRCEAPTPAAMVPYGAGCAGSNGVPVLAADSLPWLDEYYQVSATNVPGSTVGFMVLGLNDQVWNGQPLPADLTPYGLPGCHAWLAPDFSLLFIVTGGVGSWGLTVCNCPSAIGVGYSLQAVVLDAGVTTRPLAASMSNALRATVGDW